MSQPAVSGAAPSHSSAASETGWLGARLATPRAQLLALLGLASAFLIFRWLQRLEPWNSDDMDLFQFSAEAVTGQHWIFGSNSGSGVAGEHVPHTAFRIGLFPATLPAIWALGPNASAYYLVPLAFSLLGLLLMFWVLRRNFGASVALVFAVIHVAWPFELQHSSVLLTDLPAAALGIASLCLLDASAGRSLGARLGYAALAGLAGWETYLLRNNGLVLLAPALLVFLWARATRLQSLCAGGVIALGVLAQQAFLVYRGFSWGYDWSSVQADFVAYARFLPVYSWPAFLVRQFTHQLNTFGHGPTGALAVLLVLGSLSLHLTLLRFERRPLLLALAVFGLLSWLVFSFSIYERVPGGVRAMVPVNYRFIQPFTYSSLMVWAWAWRELPGRLARAGTLGYARLARLARPLASAALPVLLLGFDAAAAALHAPPTYRQGGTRRLVQAIEEKRAAAGTLSIAGTTPSLQVPRMFCGGSPHIEWRELAARDLADLAGGNARTLVLRDVPRELESARYLDPEARSMYRADLARLEAALWGGYQLDYLDTRYGLYALPDAGDPPVMELQPNAVELAPDAGSAPSLEAEPCLTSPGVGLGSRVLLPTGQGPRRANCEYLSLEDGLDLGQLSTAGPSQLVLRVTAAFEPPLSVSVDVVQVGEPGVRRQRSVLSSGSSHVPVSVQPGARGLFVVYRVTARGARAAQGVELQPARWRALAPRH
jgi:hypothetical protein